VLVLRLSRPTALLTAAVFEELFVERFQAVFELRRVPTDEWWRAVLAPMRGGTSLAEASSRVAQAVEGVDFLAPDYEATLLAPLFLALRNRARLATRLLLVAHAPGACILEWALLAPLLAPGDLIVAPTRSAADLIAFLNPALGPFVTVIPHPMLPLPGEPDRDAPLRVVSLGRIHPAKLLHRQVEALDVLRAQRRRLPQIEIAGGAESGAALAYLRSLQAKVHRLGLGEHVRFVGAVRGRDAKAAFLGGARGLLNLSVTIEESFGKAPVEALGIGLPVLSTRWDGLTETVGDGGVLVDVDCSRASRPADVSPEAVAAALERLLDDPPAARVCRDQAATFAPERIVPRYQAALERALEARARRVEWPEPEGAAGAAPRQGLLSALAPLTALSWAEMFDAYVQCCESACRSWEASAPPESPQPTTGDRLRGVLLNGARWPLEHFMSGRRETWPGSAALQDHAAASCPSGLGQADFDDRLAAAALAPGLASSRLACLATVRGARRAEVLDRGLRQLERESPHVQGIDVLRGEAAALAGDLEAAFAHAGRGLDLASDDEVTAFRLRQLARFARAGAWAERALPPLSEWLDRFPDSPDSGAVWLDRCASGAMARPPLLRDATTALEHARLLLGDLPLVDDLARRLAAEEAALALGPSPAR
jgi:glycosyltransferase involved in cell wall biosynthesis